MYESLRVGVAVPAYRAAGHVGDVLRRVPSIVDHIVVVDDASGDGTGAEVLGVAAVDPRIRLMTHADNGGVGAATWTAFKALSDLGVELLVKLDADGQMDPADIPRLLEPLARGDCGYAKGNRFHDRRALESMPRTRILGNFALTFLTKAASGQWNVADPQNGFVALRRDVFDRMPPGGVARRWFFENDLLVETNILGVPVGDVPLPARYGEESSNLRIGRVLTAFPWLLLHRFWRRVWRRYVLFDSSPVAVLLFAGVPTLLWGIGFGGIEWSNSIRSGVVASTGTVMLSVLPLILGFQMLLQALLLDIQATPRGPMRPPLGHAGRPGHEPGRAPPT